MHDVRESIFVWSPALLCLIRTWETYLALSSLLPRSLSGDHGIHIHIVRMRTMRPRRRWLPSWINLHLHILNRPNWLIDWLNRKVKLLSLNSRIDRSDLECTNECYVQRSETVGIVRLCFYYVVEGRPLGLPWRWQLKCRMDLSDRLIDLYRILARGLATSEYRDERAKRIRSPKDKDCRCYLFSI